MSLSRGSDATLMFTWVMILSISLGWGYFYLSFVGIIPFLMEGGEIIWGAVIYTAYAVHRAQYRSY